MTDFKEMIYGKNIYLSGKFGTETKKTLERFQQYEKKYDDTTFINPLYLNRGLGMVDDSYEKTEVYDRTTCFEFDIKAIQQSDGILALNNWIHSPGAVSELLIASNTGKDIYIENTNGSLTHYKPRDFRYGIIDLIQDGIRLKKLSSSFLISLAINVVLVLMLIYAYIF